MKLYQLLLLIPLTACASVNIVSPDQFSRQPDSRHAVIRVVRESSIMSSLGIARLDINGLRAASLNNGDGYEAIVNTGSVVISVDCPTAPGKTTLVLKTTANKVYRILITPRTAPVIATMAGGLIGNSIEASGSDKGTFDLELQ